MRTELTNKIYDNILETGGATVDFKTLELMDFNDGYMVGMENTESTFEFEDVCLNDFNEIVEVACEVFETMDATFRSESYLGFWVDDDMVLYVDVSKHIMDGQLARTFGKVNNQKAIYDCANKCDIELI